MNRLVLAVAVAFLLGAFVGSVGEFGAGFAGEPGSDESSDFDPPGASLSKSVGACDESSPDSGWVHDVAVGESFAVTLEATVVHDADRTVTANVSRRSPGQFRIDLVTEPTDGSTECAMTHLSLGTSLPTDYEEFTVAVNGRTLRTVEYDGTVADLHRLPNPINATDR